MTAQPQTVGCPTCRANVGRPCISIANSRPVTHVHAARRRFAEQSDLAHPSRETLLAIMERAFTPQKNWSNRDSSAAHRQLGECYALVKAGCDFYAHADARGNTYTIFLDWHGFDWFEFGGDAPTESDRFYCPTAARLDAVGPGEDWYC